MSNDIFFSSLLVWCVCLYVFFLLERGYDLSLSVGCFGIYFVGVSLNTTMINSEKCFQFLTSNRHT